MIIEIENMMIENTMTENHGVKQDGIEGEILKNIEDRKGITNIQMLRN